MNSYLSAFACMLLIALILVVVYLIFEVRAARKASERLWNDKQRKEKAEAEHKKSYDILYVPKPKSNVLGGCKTDNRFKG